MDRIQHQCFHKTNCDMDSSEQWTIFHFVPLTWDRVNLQGHRHTFWMSLVHNLWLCVVESQLLLAAAATNLCLKKEKERKCDVSDAQSENRMM